MSVHYYCGTAGNPEDFTTDEWYELLFKADFMRRIVDDHRAAMDEFNPDRKIKLVVDEWGCWHKDGTGPSKGYNLFEQQSSMRDAVVAALTINIFNNRADVVGMANVAQLCNNLHSLYLASDDNFTETGNYHVFDMFKTHQGARHVLSAVHAPAVKREGYCDLALLSASVSETDEHITLTMANLDMESEMDVRLLPVCGKLSGKAKMKILTHSDPHAVNTFENPHNVEPSEGGILLSENSVITLPKASVVSLVVEK